MKNKIPTTTTAMTFTNSFFRANGLMLSVALSIAAFPGYSQAQGGKWGQCAAYDNGVAHVISNGSWSQELCFKLAAQCMGSSTTWKAQYYSSPKMISGSSLRICKQTLRKS